MHVKKAGVTTNKNKLTIREYVLNRESLADQFISGNGIEIGALHSPLPVNAKKAAVKYVDRMVVDDLRKQYPELKDYKLVNVDYVADGEMLESVGDGSQQFVIANHFLEHCQNPILAIKNMLRVLKQGGVIFLAIPDRRFTFDKDRAITPLAHLREDYEKGPGGSRETHFREWVVYVEGVQGEDKISKRIADLLEMDYSIHYHVWEKTDMDELLVYLVRNLNFDFEITLSLRKKGTIENIYILTKLS